MNANFQVVWQFFSFRMWTYLPRWLQWNITQQANKSHIYSFGIGGYGYTGVSEDNVIATVLSSKIGHGSSATRKCRMHTRAWYPPPHQCHGAPHFKTCHIQHSTQ